MKKPVAILISGNGSNMECLVKSMDSKHPGYPFLIISNNKYASGLKKAKRLNVPVKYIPNKNFEKICIHHFKKKEPAVICLAGFMKVLSSEFVNKYAGKIINIHPSLLPKYPGPKTHERVISAKEKISGCTVHMVNESIDGGQILAQAKVDLEPTETTNSLARKILSKEHQLYPEVLKSFLLNNINL